MNSDAPAGEGDRADGADRTDGGERDYDVIVGGCAVARERAADRECWSSSAAR